METKRTGFRQTDEWRKGRTGEQVVSEHLQEIGWYVVPSYDYAGEEHEKAPRLQGKLRSFVIPDLDSSQAGRRIWMEVKTKARATFTRITQRYEHGIPRRHYDDYLEVQSITGTPVWILVYEEDSGSLLCGELNELSKVKRLYNGNKMSWGGMVFFPRDSFRLLGTLGNEPRAAPRQESMVLECQ